MLKCCIKQDCKRYDKAISKAKKVVFKKYKAQLYAGRNYSNEFVRIKIVFAERIGKLKEITIDMTIEEICDMHIKDFCEEICSLINFTILNEKS